MKNFNNYNDFAVCTMEENLQAAKLCLETPKKENSSSCYGMSAVILLSSVIDTLGMFYRNGQQWTGISKSDVTNNKLGGVKQHFERFYDKFLSNTNSKVFFINEFFSLVRCRATHNSVLGPNIVITIQKSTNGSFFEKTSNGKSWQIYLNELYEFVKNAYEHFAHESGIAFSETYQDSTGKTQN